ncbi:MAG: THUMP-like domain-containing protein [Phycisphaerales bacterium]
MDRFPGDAALWASAVAGGLDALLAQAGATDPGDAAGVSRLRRRADADSVAVALQICEARRRLVSKVPDAARWIADSTGAQMASDALAASHKAERFAPVGGEAVDLCCGIGTDAWALARAGLGVRGVDLDERRCVMTRHNAGVPTVVADAAGFGVKGALVHLDPARRDGSRRLTRLEDLAPGPEVISGVARAAGGCAVKLMPGVDPGELAGWGVGAGEVEFVSVRGRLSQAVWWTGSLARHVRSATMLADGVRETIVGEPAEPGVDEVPLGAWLLQPDPSPERAGLLGVLAERLGVLVLHPSLGLLTADGLVESAWVTAFRVLDRLPWRVARVREAVASLGGGVVEVKTRGCACDPDRAQAQLRGEGDRVLTVFVLRFGRRVEAIVTERAQSQPAAL